MGFPFSFWKFNPASVPGMAHWFEADYGVTLATTGVGSVLDRSGNNRTLTGASGTGLGGTANPTLVTGGAGGRPFFKFVSANSQKFTFTGFNPGTTFYTCAVLQGATDWQRGGNVD